MQTTYSRVRYIAAKSAGQPDRALCSMGGAVGARFNNTGMEMSFRRGARLFTEGEQPHCVFMVRSGHIKLYSTSQEGKTIILRVADGAQVLGLSAALTASELQVSAVALEHCRVSAIPVKDFLKFLADSPDAARQAIHCILEEYRVLSDEIQRLSLPATGAVRLAALLLDWMKIPQREGSIGSGFTMVLTHEEIGAMTASSRETVSRLLTYFRREKLIDTKGPSLTVLRPKALALLAAGREPRYSRELSRAK